MTDMGDLRVHIKSPSFPGDRHLGTLRDATRLDLLLALGFVEECDACGGTGRLCGSGLPGNHRDHLPNATGGHAPCGRGAGPCPVCGGGGHVLNQEAIERNARGIYGADDCYRDTWESQPEEGVKDWYRKVAEAGLRAFLEGEET